MKFSLSLEKNPETEDRRRPPTYIRRMTSIRYETHNRPPAQGACSHKQGGKESPAVTDEEGGLSPVKDGSCIVNGDDGRDVFPQSGLRKGTQAETDTRSP